MLKYEPVVLRHMRVSCALMDGVRMYYKNNVQKRTKNENTRHCFEPWTMALVYTMLWSAIAFVGIEDKVLRYEVR